MDADSYEAEERFRQQYFISEALRCQIVQLKKELRDFESFLNCALEYEEKPYREILQKVQELRKLIGD